MDKRLSFTGGEPDVRLNQILIDAEANRPAMFAMMAAFERIAGNFIVSGCDVTVGGSAPSNTWALAAGYIFLNSELVQVDAQSGTFDSSTEFLALAKQTTYNPLGDKVFIDATPRKTWQVNRGVVNVQGSVSGTELDALNGDRISTLIDFKKDIISAVQTSATADFSTDEDLIRIDISTIPANPVNISITNVVDGDDTKYLEITSSSAKSVTFTGITDASSVPNDIAAGDTLVFQVFNKNGNYFVKSIRNLVTGWQTPSYNSGFSAGSSALEYRLSNGKLEFRGDMNALATSGVAFVLPATYRPDTLVHCMFLSAGSISYCFINTIGEVYVSGTVPFGWNTVGANSFNSVLIID